MLRSLEVAMVKSRKLTKGESIQRFLTVCEFVHFFHVMWVKYFDIVSGSFKPFSTRYDVILKMISKCFYQKILIYHDELSLCNIMNYTSTWGFVYKIIISE